MPRALSLLAGLALPLLAAAPAGAADYYVDRDAPAAPNVCTFAQPCDQIAEGIDLADNDTVPDTVHVGRSNGEYTPVTATVPDSPMTLLGGGDFAGTAAAATKIDGGNNPAVSFAGGSAPRAVKGFTLQGGDLGDATVSGPGGNNITVEGNLLNENPTAMQSFIDFSGAPTIVGNTIAGTDHAGGWANGIVVDSASTPKVIGNTVTGIERPIGICGGTAGITVANNVLQPAGPDGPTGGGTPGAIGINLCNGAGGDISGNLITPGPGIDITGTGIFMSSDGPGERRLARNRVFDLPNNGVRIGAFATDPVTMNGDVIADSGGAGIASTGVATSITVTNATVVRNDTAGTLGEIEAISGSLVTLDSSIVGSDGVQQAPSIGSLICTATFSNGPAVSEQCSGQFTSNATPVFSDGYHLAPGTNPTLIDMGNPAAPAFPIDVDGDLRALDGLLDGACVPRRDIGADEVPGLNGADCDPPVPPASTPAAATPVAAANCPPGKKLVTVKKGKKKKKKCVRRKKRRRR